ncbi:hypothetical protein [Levilactobacillus angrenensis]|uniref:Uncharacterized protein n=1 Tax=Levilactobacillus angrenensis TaxID=2486020 RepID=A0ABW1U830_9LACO|nr:hypothetical protein [Levilactobacillus angrenensis]
MRQLRDFWVQHSQRFGLLLTLLLLTLVMTSLQLRGQVDTKGTLDLITVMLPSLVLGGALGQTMQTPGQRLAMLSVINLLYLAVLSSGLFLLTQATFQGPLQIDSVLLAGLVYGGWAGVQVGVEWWLLLMLLGTLQLIGELYHHRWSLLAPWLVPLGWLGYRGLLLLTAVPWSYPGVFAAEALAFLPVIVPVATGVSVAEYLYLTAHKNRRIPKDTTVHLSD